jgi:hypothetical protein
MGTAVPVGIGLVDARSKWVIKIGLISLSGWREMRIFEGDKSQSSSMRASKQRQKSTRMP